MATYETAQNQFVTVNGIKFAYRRLGPSHGIPLLLLVGFRGTMDHWDPALVNPLAAKRPVMLIDNAGVGWSEGEVPKSLTTWAQYYVQVLRALGIQRADIMGFSMGGCVAQLVALNAPGLTRRLILCGTTPSTGEGVVSAPLGPFNNLKAATTEQEHKDAWIHGLFNTSDGNWNAGEASWKRMLAARPDRCPNVDAANSHRQAIAFAKFMDPKQAKDASYNRFNELRMPVLIANGAEDLLLPSENSYLMWKMLNKANAQLHLFPNCGHGFLFQYGEEFSKMINDFLDREGSPQSRL
ncbi:Alpha/Beta hydrolase protein [Dactylonectria estremocensis]|uniref:Alpha/Beta hydrolase protein n=1 Tax=Dactylonectria estremocensis TaxID=1079267 RepID=A0A9P9IUS1_9HYPO|nr:Alpha/Beta hydrolase protein [Dactylonectria estremocensis]